MANRESISVSFTPQQAKFLASCVATGRYQSTSEVVREAVRDFEDRQARRQAQLDQAKALILEGARQLDRGETIDSAGFFDEWDKELDALEADQHPAPE